MNLRLWGLFFGVATGACAVVVAACSGGTTCSGAGCGQIQSEGGTSSGTSGHTSSGTSGPLPPPPAPPPQPPPPPPPPGGACLPQNGTYTATYTASASNAATCISADKLSGDENVNTSDLGDAGPGCTVSEVGCDLKAHCVIVSDGGPTSTVDEDLLVPGANATSFSGTITIVTTGGGVNQTCTYTFSAVKK
jgi:hypothetical protein